MKPSLPGRPGGWGRYRLSHEMTWTGDRQWRDVQVDRTDADSGYPGGAGSEQPRLPL